MQHAGEEKENTGEDARRSGKDKWDKANILLRPVGGLLTAGAVALVGFIGSSFLDKREMSSRNFQLYSQLMSQREGAESALRKDMFNSIISSFVGREVPEALLDEKLLNLELLAYNFHESLNLKPLFLHLRKRIRSSRDPDREEYVARLTRVAREVANRQTAVLKEAGPSFWASVDFEEIDQRRYPSVSKTLSLGVDSVRRTFKLEVLSYDRDERQVEVRLEITTPSDSVDVAFSVGYYDFPMIDNTRLSNDQRCAIVLTHFSEFGAELWVLYFPGSHASMREKPYFDEVVQRLLMPPSDGS